MLFREFECISGSNSAINTDYLWHKRRTNEPISIDLELLLNDADYSVFGSIDDILRSSQNILIIRRNMQFGGPWYTSEISLNGVDIVTDDQPGPGIEADHLQQIKDLVKSSFVLIRPEPVSAVTGGRFDEVPSATMNAMRQVSQAISLGEESQWARFVDVIEGMLSWRYEPQANEPLVRRAGYRLPSRNLGGGEQRLVDIIWKLQQDTPIVAIEEPEYHLHPGLARRFAQSLRDIAPDSQILITTHASQMVDKFDIRNNWNLKISEGATEATRIENDADFQMLLQNLGVFASDIFLKDFILFLEGGTEAQSVAPAWSATLGLDIAQSFNIGIVSIGGAGRLKDNLRIWLEQSRLSPADWHVILDRQPADEVQQMCRDLDIPNERITILPEHSIEDFYPTDLIVEALKVIYAIEDISSQKVSKKPRDKSIERVLQEHNKLQSGWKVTLGLYVASRMTAAQIPTEFKDVVKKIQSSIVGAGG